MEKLFAKLRTYLDEQQTLISKMPADDALFTLGDMPVDFAGIIEDFQIAATAAAETADGNVPDLNSVEVAEPPIIIDHNALVRAAVICLSVRGDIVGQLTTAGFAKEASAVSLLLTTATQKKV